MERRWCYWGWRRRFEWRGGVFGGGGGVLGGEDVVCGVVDVVLGGDDIETEEISISRW